MGYQESFIKFRSISILKKEINKYKERNTDNDLVKIVAIDKVKKEVYPFKKGDYLAVVAGERSSQRTKGNLYQHLGIKHVKKIVPIDNGLYWELSEGDIHKFFNDHFEKLTLEEWEMAVR